MTETRQDSVQRSDGGDDAENARQASSSIQDPNNEHALVSSGGLGSRRGRPPRITTFTTTPLAPAKRGRDKGDETREGVAGQLRFALHSKRVINCDQPAFMNDDLADEVMEHFPEYRMRRKPKPPFRLLDSMMQHPEIILRFSSILNVKSLMDLYAISKPFHFIMNSHYTTFIRSSAAIHAPDCGYLFPWRCYRRLTLKDPTGRRNDAGEDRDIPSLRWLQMVASRHETTIAIIDAMNQAGHHFIGDRKEIEHAIKKIWFTMDIARNGARIGTVHNSSYWTDKNIFLATFFCVKLDMRFSDPVEGTGCTALRELMLGQRSLYALRDLLQGKLSKLDILQMQVAYDWRPDPLTAHLPTMGVPPQDVGRGCLEGWGAGVHRLLRPDELLVREGIRRSLQLHFKYVDMMKWGHPIEDTEQTPVRDMARMGDENPVEDLVQRTEFFMRVKELGYVDYDWEAAAWEHDCHPLEGGT